MKLNFSSRIWGYIYKKCLFIKLTYKFKIDNYLTIFCRLTIMIFTLLLLLFLLSTLRQLKKWKHKIVMCKIARSERECTIQWQYIIFFLLQLTNTFESFSCGTFKISFEYAFLFLNWLNDFESAFFSISFKHFYKHCSSFQNCKSYFFVSVAHENCHSLNFTFFKSKKEFLRIFCNRFQCFLNACLILLHFLYSTSLTFWSFLAFLM